MKIDGETTRHLTYCMNVHPGESWDDVLEAIRIHVVPLRERTAPGRAFGLGLRLSHAAVEAATPEAVAELKGLLDAHDLYVFTINAFPFGTFHGERVKEHVYQPDWRSVERRDYTLRVADIAAQLAGAGETVSISTVPGSYGAWIETEDDVRLMVEHLMDVVAHLVTIEAGGGCRITLGLEPEPDCYLQTTPDVLAFFAGPIETIGHPYLDQLLGDSTLNTHNLIARHLGICFDTCHLALQFESLEESLHALADAGILISKVQISSALHMCHTADARQALQAFLDPVYLHQVKIRSSAHAALKSYPDLDVALKATAPDADEAWRIHFQVPLYFKSYGALGSTAGELSPSFFKALKAVNATHLEIETYTFDVLPPDLRALGIDQSLALEYDWVLKRL
ncbi:MAG: metabolite traffic protein EboE [Verrucomicrobia bacterium]|nr:metabolite traffic protein EboE [Verrucomicrobiota bacterium]